MKKLIVNGMTIAMLIGASGCSVNSSSPYGYSCQGVNADMRCKNS